MIWRIYCRYYTIACVLSSKGQLGGEPSLFIIRHFVVFIFIGLIIIPGTLIFKMGSLSAESIKIFVRPKLLDQLEEIATVEVIALINNERPFEVNEEQVQELKNLVANSPYPTSHWLAISRLARIYHKTQPDGYKDELAQMLTEKFASCHGHFSCIQMVERLFEIAETIPSIVVDHLPHIKKRIDNLSFTNDLIKFYFQTIHTYAEFIKYTGIMNHRSRSKVNQTLGVPSDEIKNIRMQLHQLNNHYKDLETILLKWQQEKEQGKNFPVYVDILEGEEKELFNQLNPDVEISEYLINYIHQKMTYLKKANYALYLYTERYEVRTPMSWLMSIKEKTELSLGDTHYLSTTDAFWLLVRFCRLEFELPYRREWIDAMRSLGHLAWKKDPEQREGIEAILAQKQKIYENINNFYESFLEEEYNHLSSGEKEFIKQKFSEEQEKHLFNQGGIFLSFFSESLSKIKLYIELEEVTRKYEEIRSKKENQSKKEIEHYEKKYYQLVDLNSIRWLRLQCSFMAATYNLNKTRFSRYQNGAWSHPHWRRTPISHENYSMREACYFYGSHLRKLRQFAASPTISQYVRNYIIKLAPKRRVLKKTLNSTEFQLALSIVAIYMTGGTYNLLFQGGKSLIKRMVTQSTAKKISQKMAQLPPSLVNTTGQTLTYMGKGTLQSLIYTLMYGSLAVTVGNKSVFKKFGDYYTYNAVFYLAYPAYMKAAGMIFQRASVAKGSRFMAKKARVLMQKTPALMKLSPVMNHSLMRGFLSVNRQVLSYVPVAPMVSVVDNVWRNKSKKYWKNTKELSEEIYTSYLFVIFSRCSAHLVYSH